MVIVAIYISQNYKERELESCKNAGFRLQNVISYTDHILVAATEEVNM